MNSARITWAEAERLAPGIEAEWRKMLGNKEFYNTPPADIEVRLEATDEYVALIQIDHEDKWVYPPEWRRWYNNELQVPGFWSHPIPCPKTLYCYCRLSIIQQFLR